MIQPDFREFQRLAKQGNLIPLYDVFSADLLTPVSAYLRIAQGARYSFLLESVEGGEKIARYTFAGAHPEEVFRYANGACVLESRDRVVWEERDPISFLRERIERFRPVRIPGLPPLVAGAIGYFSYDMVRLIVCPGACATKSASTTQCSCSITALSPSITCSIACGSFAMYSPRARAAFARNTMPRCAKLKRRAGFWKSP
jgi:anthranilate/para-aminobenzoate synthase component I